MNQCPQNPCCSSHVANYAESIHFFERLKIPFTIKRGNSQGWRIRAKLAVRGTSEKPLIGLFKEGTHEVYEIPHCTAHHPLINQAQSLVKKWIQSYGLSPYDEKSHTGLLRYLQFIVERPTNLVQVSFVLNSSAALPIDKLLESSPPHFWHSIWLNIHPTQSNTIFGPDWQCLYGEKWIEEQIANYPACYLPGSFGQANLEMFEELIRTIEIPSKQRLIEFYAGIGIIGIALAEKCQSVLLNEINPLSYSCFEETVKRLPAHITSKLTYKCESAQNQLDLLEQGDIILVDPPRKGLSPPFIKALQSTSTPHTLIYISCDWNSFTRDALALEPHWQIQRAFGFPFFPGTPHLETLCFFKKLEG